MRSLHAACRSHSRLHYKGLGLLVAYCGEDNLINTYFEDFVVRLLGWGYGALEFLGLHDFKVSLILIETLGIHKFSDLPSVAVSACCHAHDSTQHALQQLIADRVLMDGLGNIQLYI